MSRASIFILGRVVTFDIFDIETRLAISDMLEDEDRLEEAKTFRLDIPKIPKTVTRPVFVTLSNQPCEEKLAKKLRTRIFHWQYPKDESSGISGANISIFEPAESGFKSVLSYSVGLNSKEPKDRAIAAVLLTCRVVGWHAGYNTSKLNVAIDLIRYLQGFTKSFDKKTYLQTLLNDLMI